MIKPFEPDFFFAFLLLGMWSKSGIDAFNHFDDTIAYLFSQFPIGNGCSRDAIYRAIFFLLISSIDKAPNNQIIQNDNNLGSSA